MFEIVIETANRDVRQVRCLNAHCGVGKSGNNLVVLQGWDIADDHAAFRARPDGIFMEVLGGRAPVTVNGNRVANRHAHGPLRKEDIVGIGAYRLRVLADAPAAEAVDGSHRPSVSNDAYGARADGSNGANGAHSGSGLRNGSGSLNAQNSRGRAGDSERNPSGTSGARAALAPGVMGHSTTGRHTAAQAAAPVVPSRSVVNSDMLDWRLKVHASLLRQMDLRRLDVRGMKDDELRDKTAALIEDILTREFAQMPPNIERRRLAKEVLDEAIGLGPLEDLLADDSVTEVMVNRSDQIFIERAGRIEESPVVFSSDQAVLGVIERIVAPLGRRIDESSPMVDARLKDGSRVNAIIPPVALRGPSISIRKFSKRKLVGKDLINFGSMNHGMLEFLEVAVRERRNIVVTGGTGSGKTTLLNVLSNFIPDHERIVTIEDAAELKLSQPNLVGLESRPANLEGKGLITIRDLVRNALRMRPDRIVVGECRGGEALDMLQAMNTGHEGSLTTAHANSPRDALSRLEVMVLMSSVDLPMVVVREQICSALDLIIHQRRFPCGSRKVTHISEITGIESGTIQTQDIFTFTARDQGGPNGKVRGEFSATGAVPEFYEELAERGVNVDLAIFNPREGRA
jgi:pilus assembly protein CpaF